MTRKAKAAQYRSERLYLLDQETGEPLYGIDEKTVPQLAQEVEHEAAAETGGAEETTPADTTTTETSTTETSGGGEATAGDPAAGRDVFASAGCGSCHTLADAGASGSVGPNLDDSKPSAELVVDRVTNGQGVIPPFGDSLSEQQIAEVAAYVSSVAGAS